MYNSLILCVYPRRFIGTLRPVVTAVWSPRARWGSCTYMDTVCLRTRRLLFTASQRLLRGVTFMPRVILQLTTTSANSIPEQHFWQKGTTNK